jgi:hypothetical protein
MAVLELTRDPDARRGRTILLLAQVSHLGLFHDHLLFGFARRFWLLVAIRALLLVASLMAWPSQSGGAAPGRRQRPLLAWSLFAALAIGAIGAVRPPGFPGTTISAVAATLAVYAFLPLRTTWQSLPALVIVIGVVGRVLPIAGSTLLDRSTVVLPLALANVVGFVASSREQSLRREEQLGLPPSTGAGPGSASPRSLLPICMYCRRVRNDESGSWERVESYVRERSQLDFSHGVCPECEPAHLDDLLVDDDG